MSKPILVLSWSIPPALTGSGRVMANLLRQFTRQEMIVVGAWYMAHPPFVWQANWPQLVYALVQPPEHWRGERFFRLAQWPILFLVSLTLCLVRRCRAVLAVYPDGLFLLAGYLISRIANLPLYGYFHNTYLENFREDRLARWLQPRLFSQARAVFTMSEGMQAFYQRMYPEVNFIVLKHTHNHPIPQISQVCLPALHHPLRLAFVGNLNSSCLEAAQRFLQLVQGNPDLELYIISGENPATLARFGFRGERIFSETVPENALLDRTRQMDILIHPHGFQGSMQPHEYQTIFPTKTIDYLLSQRPILAHLPADSYLAEFYRQHQCAYIVGEPSLDALAKGLEQLRADPGLRLRLVQNALKASSLFIASDVAQILRKTIDEPLT